MDDNRRGFTIVEVLIVIFVLGVLAAIAIPVYAGIQLRATHNAQVVELREYAKLFKAYKIIHGQYPTPPFNFGYAYCLGDDFPLGSDGEERCGGLDASASSYEVEDSTSLLQQLRTVGTLPKSPRVVVNNQIGPYVLYNNVASGNPIVRLATVFQGQSDYYGGPNFCSGLKLTQNHSNNSQSLQGCILELD